MSFLNSQTLLLLSLLVQGCQTTPLREPLKSGESGESIRDSMKSSTSEKSSSLVLELEKGLPKTLRLKREEHSSTSQNAKILQQIESIEYDFGKTGSDPETILKNFIDSEPSNLSLVDKNRVNEWNLVFGAELKQAITALDVRKPCHQDMSNKMRVLEVNKISQFLYFKVLQTKTDQDPPRDLSSQILDILSIAKIVETCQIDYSGHQRLQDAKATIYRFSRKLLSASYLTPKEARKLFVPVKLSDDLASLERALRYDFWINVVLRTHNASEKGKENPPSLLYSREMTINTGAVCFDRIITEVREAIPSLRKKNCNEIYQANQIEELKFKLKILAKRKTLTHEVLANLAKEQPNFLGKLYLISISSNLEVMQLYNPIEQYYRAYIGLALEVFRQNEKRFPKSIEKLVESEILDSIPRTPLSHGFTRIDSISGKILPSIADILNAKAS